MHSTGWRCGRVLLLFAVLSAGLATGLLSGWATVARAQERYVDLEIVKALRYGGHVLVMRHATADPNQFDADPRNFKAIRRQQQLTDKGRREVELLIY